MAREILTNILYSPVGEILSWIILINWGLSLLNIIIKVNIKQ